MAAKYFFLLGSLCFLADGICSSKSHVSFFGAKECAMVEQQGNAFMLAVGSALMLLGALSMFSAVKGAASFFSLACLVLLFKGACIREAKAVNGLIPGICALHDSFNPFFVAPVLFSFGCLMLGVSKSTPLCYLIGNAFNWIGAACGSKLYGFALLRKTSEICTIHGNTNASVNGALFFVLGSLLMFIPTSAPPASTPDWSPRNVQDYNVKRAQLETWKKSYDTSTKKKKA